MLNRIIGLIVLGVCMAPAQAQDGLYLSYDRFVQDGRDSLIYPYPHKERFSLQYQAHYDWLYIDSRIYTLTSGQEFVGAGSETQLGIQFPNELRLYYQHRSEHCLDRSCPNGFYPVYDSIGIRIPLMVTK